MSRKRRKRKKEFVHSYEECENAICLKSLSKNKVYFEDYNRNFFKLLPEPRSGDWLASFDELPQPFGVFSKSHFRKVPKNKRKIYLQPIGEFEEKTLIFVKNFCEIYFGNTQIEFLPTYEIVEGKNKNFVYYENKNRKIKIRSRINSFTKVRQICTEDVLEKFFCPKDGYCNLIITMEDLFPNKKWNYVFGFVFSLFYLFLT